MVLKLNRTDYINLLILMLPFSLSILINFLTSPGILYDEVALLGMSRDVALSPIDQTMIRDLPLSVIGHNTSYLFLTGLLFKVFAPNMWFARFSTTLLGYLLAVTLYFYVKGRHNRPVALSSSLIFSMTPSVFAHTRIFSTPIFGTLLSAAAFFCFLRSDRAGAYHYSLLSAFLLFIAYTTRITHIAVFPLFFVFILVRDGLRRAVGNRSLWATSLTFVLLVLVFFAVIGVDLSGTSVEQGDAQKFYYAITSPRPFASMLQNLSGLLIGFHAEYGVYYILPHLILVSFVFLSISGYPKGEEKLLLSLWFFYFFCLHLIGSGLYRNYLSMFIPASIFAANFLYTTFLKSRVKACLLGMLLLFSSLGGLSFFVIYSNDGAIQIVDYLDTLPKDARIGTDNVIVHELSNRPLIYPATPIQQELDYYVSFGTELQRGKALNDYLESKGEVVFSGRYEPNPLAKVVLEVVPISFGTIRGEGDNVYLLR